MDIVKTRSVFDTGVRESRSGFREGRTFHQSPNITIEINKHIEK